MMDIFFEENLIVSLNSCHHSEGRTQLKMLDMMGIDLKVLFEIVEVILV